MNSREQEFDPNELTSNEQFPGQFEALKKEREEKVQRNPAFEPPPPGPPATEEDVEKLTCTSRELADYWGVSIQVISTAAKRGVIPGTAKFLGHYIFNKEEAIAGWTPRQVIVREGGEIEQHVGGRFAKGNTIGVGGFGGRPKREVELKFLTTLVQTVSEDDWEEIIIKTVALAKTGDAKARTWLGNYLIGVPVRRIEAKIDTTERKEFEIGERAAAIEAILAMVQARTALKQAELQAKAAGVEAGLGLGPVIEGTIQKQITAITETPETPKD